MLAERATHLDYKPEDLLHIELLQNPRRYEATMTDGEVLILPSVTTILSGGSGEGWNGNEATRIGTAVHDLIAQLERALADVQAGIGAACASCPPGDRCIRCQAVINAFGLWARWRGLGPALCRLPVLVEVPVCSVRHGFAGTLDLLYLESSLVLHDHKTSQELREEAITQVVAYALALDEMLEAGTAPAGTVPYGPADAVQVGRFGKTCESEQIRRVERASWAPYWRRFLAKLESR